MVSKKKKQRKKKGNTDPEKIMEEDREYSTMELEEDF